MLKDKLVIIGAGNVGSTVAYTAALRGVVSEVVLTDVDLTRAQGHADDIMHAVMYLETSDVRAGGYEEIEDAKYVIITAGAKQNPGETRLDLLNRNVSITKSILDSMKPYLSDQIILFVSNPVDVLTYFAQKYLNYDKAKIFGSGTALDTARLRYLLGDKIKVNPSNIHAYIMGEHGDSSVAVYSTADVAGISLSKLGLDAQELAKTYTETRDAAYRVIESKGATYYAIGVIVNELIEAIHYGQNRVFPVSTHLDDYHGISDVSLSVPCVLGKGGVQRFLETEFNEAELEGLKQSAEKLKSFYSELPL